MTEDEKMKFLKKMGYSGGLVAVALGKETRESYRQTLFSKYDKTPKDCVSTTKETSSVKPEKKDNRIDKGDLLFVHRLLNPTN